MDNLDDAEAIAAHCSTLLQNDELNYPYLHTLNTYRLERRLIKGCKSIFCNTEPWQITVAKSFSLMVTSKFEGLMSL